MEALRVQTSVPRRLAAVRHTGPYNKIGPAFRELGKIAAPAGLFRNPDARMVGVYHDDPNTTEADKLRSAAGVIISDDAPIPPGLAEEAIQGGEFAVTTHLGPYDGLPAAWRRAGEAVAAGGRKHRNAASYEIYLNDPTQVAEAELKTEIWIPIE
jgi:AraC family transcriptional regulator